ncbi:chemotaxis protein CheD [bacterium]|nr:chemotaxis protein CheD [bacterium]
MVLTGQERELGLRSVVVDISGFAVTRDPSEVLITYSLGSCLGFTLFDPVAGVAGMVHCMLPFSKIDQDKALEKPGMFVDTGVPTLLEAAFRLGAEKKRLVLKAAGCGAPLDDKGLFRIGERNYMVLKKLLWKNDLLLSAEDVGGKTSRTVKVYASNGDVIIRSGGKETPLI